MPLIQFKPLEFPEWEEFQENRVAYCQYSVACFQLYVCHVHIYARLYNSTMCTKLERFDLTPEGYTEAIAWLNDQKLDIANEVAG